MFEWESSFEKAIESFGPSVRALEESCRALEYTPLQKAEVLLKGVFVHVVDLQKWWVRQFVIERQEGQRLQECLSEGFEGYFSFLLLRSKCFFQVMRYWLPYKTDAFFEHVWCLSDQSWRMAQEHDTTFSYYTKRLSLGYAYGRTLCWWDQHQDADLVGLMQEWHRHVRQAQYVGKGVKSMLSSFDKAQGFYAHNNDKEFR